VKANELGNNPKRTDVGGEIHSDAFLAALDTLRNIKSYAGRNNLQQPCSLFEKKPGT
jgi:hypothetical protein